MPGTSDKKKNPAQAQPKPARKKQAPNPDGKKSKKKQERKAQRDVERKKRIQQGEVRNVPVGQLVYLGNVLPSVDFKPTLNSSAIRQMVTGYLSFALQNGFIARAAGSEVAHSWQFTANLIHQAILGEYSPSNSVPFWLAFLCQALQPKVARRGLGGKSYAFVYTANAPTVAATYPIGATAYGYDYPLYSPGATQAMGFPICDDFINNAYSEDSGSAAFQSLVKLMVKTLSTGGPAKRASPSLLLPPTQETKGKFCVSSFAVCADGMGYGSTNGGVNQEGGAWTHDVQLECPLTHPLLACCSSGADVTNRLSVFHTQFGGDPTFLTGAMSSMLMPDQWAMKRNPKFKTVDFLEFLDVMAIWVAKVQQSIINEENGGQNDPIQTNITCPLTLQELGLLLRAVMMAAFKDTQPAVQGMGPLKPSVGTDNYPVAFLAAPGTCCLISPQMFLPVPLLENIKACIYRKTYPASNHHDVDLFIPVLSKFVLDTLDETAYGYTVQGEFVKSFTDPAEVYLEAFKGKTGQTEYKPLAETPVDYVDGYGGSNYIAINDPNRLTQLVGIWNEWVTGTLIASHSCQLAQWNTDLGISILASIGMTRHINTLSPTREVEVARNVLLDKRFRAKNHKYLTATPYSSRRVVLTSFHDLPYASAYEGVQSTWITPINYIASNQINGVWQSSQINRVQAMYGEDASVVNTSSDVGMEMASMHSAYAAKMVKGRLQARTQWDEFFSQMEQYGRGGILSSLAGGLAKAIFPSQSGLIDTIASVVPF